MTHDDPKLTAYALNELDQADRAEVEAYLAENPAARLVVEEIRRTVAMLTAGLQAVKTPALTTTQREMVAAAVAAPVVTARSISYEPVRRPERRAWAKWALATAACAALAAAGYVVLQKSLSPPKTVGVSMAVSSGQNVQRSAVTQPQGAFGSSGGLTLNRAPGSASGGDATQYFAAASPDYKAPVSGPPSPNLKSVEAAITPLGGVKRIETEGDTLRVLRDASGPEKLSEKIAGKEVRGYRVGFASDRATGVPGGIGATGAGSSGGGYGGGNGGRGGGGGISSSPDTRSSLFVLPANRSSYVTSDPSVGQKNIPYVDRFNNTGDTTLQNGVGSNVQPGSSLAQADISALVAHYRQRGGEGVNLLDGELGYTQAQFEQDAKTGNFPPEVIAAMQRQVEHTATAPNESYAAIHDNPFLPVADQPLSTFSIDVDTGSYSNIRRFLNDGQFPPPDAVRIEEMLNYFPYQYATPKPDSKEPFATTIEIAGCPWNSAHRLARMAIKGREIAHDKRPVSNLVFLIDVSGSMNEPAKLPLVKEGLKLMVNELTENDRISIVVYAGNAGLVLPSTTADPKEKDKILSAIDNLSAGGSTNGGQGIELAYKIASDNFIKGGTNRVLLATDGDWNVGITDQSSLTQLIEDKAKSGVFLSVLGYGFGNLKDATMEKLADKGNGHYAYIDNIKESKKVLIEEMSSTLVTIAKDVKIQVEFNPAKVESYRLIGYEKRLLRKEDFNNDKVDAGEIGAGHCVTALYEITPLAAGEKGEPKAAQPASDQVDALKYQKHEVLKSEDLMTLKLRYKQPDGDQSAKLEFPAIDKGVSYSNASEDFKFSAAVAQFGMILRHSPYKGSASLDGVLELGDEGKGKDEKGYRAEFLEMVKKAKNLSK